MCSVGSGRMRHVQLISALRGEHAVLWVVLLPPDSFFFVLDNFNRICGEALLKLGSLLKISVFHTRSLVVTVIEVNVAYWFKVLAIRVLMSLADFLSLQSLQVICSWTGIPYIKELFQAKVWESLNKVAVMYFFSICFLCPSTPPLLRYVFRGDGGLTN